VRSVDMLEASGRDGRCQVPRSASSPSQGSTRTIDQVSVRASRVGVVVGGLLARQVMDLGDDGSGRAK